MSVRCECQRCGACCRWPGQVKVSDAEIVAIAAQIGLNVGDVIERYARLRLDRQGLMLAEKDNGECVFLNEVDCLIHGVKPRQCRTFPDEWNLLEHEEKCQAQKWLIPTDGS